NDFMLLKRIGGECAGAIIILPESCEQYSYHQLSGGQLSELIKKIPERPLLAGEDGIRISLAGAQEKVVLFLKDSIFYIPLNGAPSNYILKPGMLHFPSSIENECFCMMLADDLNLPVPSVKILKEKEQKALLIKRYDRVYGNDSVRRLHQEDFCQAMGVSYDRKYEFEGGPGLGDCFQLIDQCSIQPLLDKKKLLDWVVFNYCIGNADAHGKNVSLLYAGHGVFLAPFYDLISTVAYPGLSKKMAMSIGGENRFPWVKQRHWERLAETINLKPRVVLEAVEEMSARVTQEGRKLKEEKEGKVVGIVGINNL
ncbi:MAG: type II toxin-antitoxin system HipA family toxin, partial [Candidatus Omnitrophica bacterium]|nr:type II toxin-antitoxin system HipA family toxin [Candidatus Omnitrophota bacterium]